MKKTLFTFLIVAMLAPLPGCHKRELSASGTPLNIKVVINYAPPNITINPPVPDPARIAKGDKVTWSVTVVPATSPLDVTIDGFQDTSGKNVDVFGDGSTYRIGGASSGQSAMSGAAARVSDAGGFKYRITAVSSTGDKKILDPRIIVSAGFDGSGK